MSHKQIFARLKSAEKAIHKCNLCPRRCGIDRTRGEKGYCGLDDNIRCFLEMVYCGEEEQLNPSHQIHFSGCNLRCEYCVSAEWNRQPLRVKELDIDKMAETIALRQNKGVKTVNLLGGEPAVNVYGILKLLSRLKPEIKVVWNSNMFYNDVVEDLMSGLIDIYLADIKCGNSECAGKLLQAENYLVTVKRNILRAAGNGDMIVRHLILPGHSECCLKPVLRWLAEELHEVKLSLRGNYAPPIPAIYSPTEYLDTDEMQRAIDFAENIGLRIVK